MKEIPLTQGKVSFVDDEDFEFLSRWKWSNWTTSRRRTSYAIRSTYINGKRGTIFMHRAILGLSDSSIHGDHHDGNGLNNIHSNLRTATCSQNSHNRQIPLNNSSGFKGVYRHKYGRSWHARIKVNDKMLDCGHYQTPANAAIAYNIAALQYFGEFARLNT